MVKLDLNAQSEFAWVQSQVVDEVERQYNAGKPVRIINLKARQLGLSTITQGIDWNWGFIHQGANSLLLAHYQDTADEIFSKKKVFLDNWPFRGLYHLSKNTLKHMAFAETRSSYRAMTARTLASRGMTFHFIHATECAFYPDPEGTFNALNQTMPDKHGTAMILESTANGTGDWWHKQWLAAMHRESEFIPLFFPWFPHPEYQRTTTLCTQLELTPYERWLMKQGATYGNIAWRRWMIPNKMSGDETLFKQEYPAIPQEAFQSTGRNLFSEAYLNHCYTKKAGVRGFLIDNPDGSVRFVHDPSGNLTIFAAPYKGDKRWDRYFVAGDPSESIQGDPSCIQVLNRKTLEQVAVWHGRTNPIHFADDMIRVGKFYNMAQLCPEVQGGGQACVATILAKGYPNVWVNRYADQAPGKVGNVYGWSNNQRFKSWMIGHLQRLVIDMSITIHDEQTYDQMLNYVERNDGSWGNADPDMHDDSVMALAICALCSHSEGPFIETSGREPTIPGIERALETVERDGSLYVVRGLENTGTEDW